MKTNIYIREGAVIAWLAAKQLRSPKAAIVIGRTIYLHNTTKATFLNNKAWLLHELQHVAQYQQHGVIRFLVLYLYETLLQGYHNNRFEVAARAAERDESLLKQFTITA